MDDLTDSELIMLGGDADGCDCVFCRANAEIRRRRATMLRLEQWASDIETSSVPWGGDLIANQVRALLKVSK